MATRPYVPRVDGESSIGVPTKKWGKIFAYEIDEETDLGNNQSLGYRQPSTAQSVGDIRYHATLPAGWYLECTTAGTTGSGALTITSPTVGGTVSDGTVTWTIRKNASTQDLTGYLPLSGGAMTGDVIYRAIDSQKLELRGGSNNRKGGLLQLFGVDNADTVHRGFFGLGAVDSGGQIRWLEGLNNGTLTWNNNSLDKSAVVAESLAENGYRKYASGLIEQWGLNYLNNNGSKEIGLSISFTSNNYIVVGTMMGNSSLNIVPTIERTSLSSITIRTSQTNTVPCFWHAIGY